MVNGVFSEFSNYADKNNTVNSASKDNLSEKKTDLKKDKVLNTVKDLAPIVVPLVTIPITAGITYKLANKNVKALNSQITGLKTEISGLKSQLGDVASASKKEIQSAVKKYGATKKDDAKIWSAIIALTGLSSSFHAGKLSEKEKDEVIKQSAESMQNVRSSANEALSKSNQAIQSSGNSLANKYTIEVSPGINLLKNTDALNRNSIKYAKAIEQIQTVANKHLTQAPEIKTLKPDSALWSVTSEFAPIKEGGLGSVPVEVQDNAAKLGVKMPTFIPMYQQKGIASLKQEGDEYTYKYKNKSYKLEKAATFQIDTYQGGKSKVEDVEVFVPVIDASLSDDEKEALLKRQLIFIKNDTYFNGSIYNTNAKTEEPEKFAFFSKAVYEFAKAKVDENSIKGLNITNRESFDSVPAPDGFILNDWQASPIAALSRYKAPIENAYGQLSDEASEKLANMNIITIGHNAQYQGSSQINNSDDQRYQATTNILNTLFDEYAADIVENAKTGATDINPDDEGLKNLDNVLILNKDDKHYNHTSLLNMGVCLSDYFHPVSENYAKELVTEPEKAGELMWAMTQRNDAGSLVGIINGNDFNRLSIEARQGMIKNQTGLDFETYNKESNIQDIKDARANNKENFYNNYMVPLSETKGKNNLEFVDPKGNTNLERMSSDELANTPIITSVGRLVSQKGIDIMSDAIKMLLDNWDKDFPGKNKPIFYLAGSDGEGGAQRKHIENLKANKLNAEDSKRVIFAHGFAPMTAITAASDFFLLPSRFEPCGLTQGEAFAVGTPVIGSAVGGIVDTVNRNGKTNGILTPENTPLNAKNFYKAMKEGLKIYFEKPEQYQQMVKDSLAEDFSWIQKGKQGPVYDYLEKLGIDRKELPSI